LFPSNETYQVRTLVNGSSLEDCSIIRSNDKIRPYFAVSVVNDPDLIGLLVYLQDSQGKIIGDKIQFTLLPYADETALTEAQFQKEEEEEKPNEEAPNETEPNEADEVEPTSPEHQVMERWTFTDAKPLEKNYDIEVAVKSFSTQLPYFPLPKELEIGPYILVFEALGKKDTLSRMETNVYYLGSAEFNLKDIAMYLPGLSSTQLISPGTVIMLESSLNFDSQLDPYVIWYNGKAIISEGKISDGAGKLLWEAPEQAGFYSLRLEAFPFHLKRAVYTGLSREIALPVSPRAIGLGHFFENNQEHTARSPLAIAADEETPPELLQWYQFEGSLRNSLSNLIDEQTLLPVKESPARWAAAGQSYGLAIGPDDPYLLSPINFFREEQDQGGGIFLFHVRPLSEGIIFSAFFPLESSLTEGVWMEMIREGNAITLRLSAAGAFVELPVYLTFSATEGFIPIAVEFYLRPYRLEAKISLDDNTQNKVGEIKLPGALSGEGSIWLGSGADKPALAKPALKPETAVLDETSADTPASTETFSHYTVWDELAILLSAVPLLPEIVAEQDAAANAVADAIVSKETTAREVDVNIKPAAMELSISDSEEADSEDPADFIEPVEEQETQERETLIVISEDF